MNPLSFFTYYRRHKCATLLLVSLITLTTLGIGVMVGALDSVVAHIQASTLGRLTYLSQVRPIDLPLDPALIAQIRTRPDVAQVIPENGLTIIAPALGVPSPVAILGVPEADVEHLMAACRLRLKEGRLLEPRTNGILLSEEVANALGLHVGDQISRSIDETRYEALAATMELVGILESDPSIAPNQKARLGIASYEYLDGHEAYAPRQSGLIVVAQEGRKAAVDAFLQADVSSDHTSVVTYEYVRVKYLAPIGWMSRIAFTIADCLVAVVVALVVGVINWIALTQRLSELGLLHAIGHHKRRLVRRLTLETAIVAGIGWIAGLILTWLTFAWLRLNVYEPAGVALSLANLTPFWFAVPIPLTVVGFAFLSTARTFAHLDAVSIIERGSLGAEGKDRRRTPRRSSARPLSSWTFYLRHRRRGILLTGAVALMILGVTFPAFFISAAIEAYEPFHLGHLRYVSEIKPGVNRSVDPAVAGQIRAHPSVVRVIPATELPLSIDIPFSSLTFGKLYAVSGEDIPYLVNLFGMRLKEGVLPQPSSNGIVLSEKLALNRGLSIGDLVGHPVYEQDTYIPTKMEVVGILDSDDVSLGLASLEYLEGHERYVSHSVHLLVVPGEGRKAEMDRWLEGKVDSARTLVETHATARRESRQLMRGLLVLIATVESAIAIVAAIALAALNTIFFSQRREEWGALYAMGHGRLWLVLRIVKESFSVVTMAWFIGAAVCILGLSYASANVYGPKGLSVNLYNPAPWLFTLPIPLAVVVAGAGTIAWMLNKLDPVAVIERR
jgi:ABC-type lipoprotein release transport system permease subunit